jgi:NADH:ubiquinone oxidoreductase subunit 5 (subunit L)/multisubunit Na+/H+ antiporter MnhA subunit
VPTETITTTNERVASEEASEIVRSREDDALRKLALQHLEHVRKFKFYLLVYVLSMIVLTPVWIVTQYETADGWLEHLSTRSRYPGDWDPWIIWVALVGAVLVAIAGFRAYFSRADTEGEIEREVERLRSTR